MVCAQGNVVHHDYVDLLRPCVDRSNLVVEDGGENIQRYELAYQDTNNEWHIVAKNTSGKDLIFPHRIFHVSRPAQQIAKLGGSPLAQAKKIRFRILNSSHPPEIVEIAAANCKVAPIARCGGGEDLPRPLRRRARN